MVASDDAVTAAAGVGAVAAAAGVTRSGSFVVDQGIACREEDDQRAPSWEC